MQRIKAEENEWEHRLKEKRAQLTQCEQAIVKHKKDVGRLQTESQQAQSVVDKLQDDLDRDAVEEGRLDAIKEQLAEAESEKETHENSYQESVVEKDKLFKALKATKDQMTGLDRAIKEAEAKLSKAEHKAAQRANSRERALREKNAALEAVEEADQERRRTQGERDQQDATVETFIEEANKVSSRIPVERGETCRSLEEKLNKMRADLAKSEKRYYIHILYCSRIKLTRMLYRIGGNAAQIAADAAKASDALQRARGEVESVESLVQVPMPQI